MLGAQPVLDAGDAQDENLGAAGGIGVIGNLQDKPSAGPPFGPALYARGLTRDVSGTPVCINVDRVLVSLAASAKQASPPLFLSELVRLGLSHAPQFPDLGGAYD